MKWRKVARFVERGLSQKPVSRKTERKSEALFLLSDLFNCRYNDAMNTNLNSMAASATLHCLTGCAIGEIAGMIIGAELGLGTGATILLATILAFISGYSLSTLPLVRQGLGFISALSLVFAADTLSILAMEITDNAVMAVIPGAMDAGMLEPLFWGSMVLSLGAAFIVAYPVNRYLLKRGKGHALTHAHHDHTTHETHNTHGHEDHSSHLQH
jgi:hypothetical protein